MHCIVLYCVVLTVFCCVVLSCIACMYVCMYKSEYACIGWHQSCRRYRSTISFIYQTIFLFMDGHSRALFHRRLNSQTWPNLEAVCSSRLFSPESVWHILGWKMGTPFFFFATPLTNCTDLSTRCGRISGESSHDFQGCGQMLFSLNVEAIFLMAHPA